MSKAEDRAESRAEDSQAADAVSKLIGGPIFRYGGKGQHAHLIVPRFARAKVYAEPCFGAGSIFFRLPQGTYEREAVNDLDNSLVTFFRVLRDQPAELIRLCEATPYARAEFIDALVRSPDPLEEARRVWVRGRQGFSGKAKTAGDWGRNPGDKGGKGGGAPWLPGRAVSKCDSLSAYATRLRNVAIDCIDAVEFVAKWGASRHDGLRRSSLRSRVPLWPGLRARDDPGRPSAAGERAPVHR